MTEIKTATSETSPRVGGSSRESAIVEEQLKSRMSEICGALFLNERWKTIMANIAQWVLHSEDGPLNPRKGLWIYGGVGTGKSALLKAIVSTKLVLRRRERDQSEIQLPTGAPTDPDIADGFIPSASDIVWKFIHNGPERLDAYAEYPFCAIDDLGREPLWACYKGNRFNVLEELLLLRSSNPSNPTVIATDLSLPEVRKIYGEPLYDRLGGMFNFIPMLGPSFREPIPEAFLHPEEHFGAGTPPPASETDPEVF